MNKYFRRSGLTAEQEKNYYIYDQYSPTIMEPVAPIGIISLAGSGSYADEVNSYLYQRRLTNAPKNRKVSRYSPGYLREDYTLPYESFRFSTGEGKALLPRSVRGHDLFILTDVLNYSRTYNFYGKEKRMSPDEHYSDLLRIILAASGKARRINIIMPFLYEGRQHRRSLNESLDAAYMLEELHSMGIDNFITFDAHDPRVSNAIPINGFETIPTTYQIFKALFAHIPSLAAGDNRIFLASPDEGGMQRAMYYASMLGAPLGTFYKRRDFTTVVDGRNPIVEHEFLGHSVRGYDILIVDDMIASGESILDIAAALRKNEARNIYCAVSFGLFTSGLEAFDKAYEEGVISKVFSTNLIYRTPELLRRPWYVDVSISKFIALLVDAINHDASLSRLVEPAVKIRALLERHNIISSDQPAITYSE